MNESRGNWLKRARKSLFYRQKPLVPGPVDPTYESKESLMELIQGLRNMSTEAADKEAFLAAVEDAKAAFLGTYQHPDGVKAPELPARSDHLERFVRVMHP
jgi:hypothetical protein